MNEFEGYGEENSLKAEAGWSNMIGWGYGSAPGRGSDFCTGGTPFVDICSPEPFLGAFLIYVLCLAGGLIFCLWMI